MKQVIYTPTLLYMCHGRPKYFWTCRFKIFLLLGITINGCIVVACVSLQSPTKARFTLVSVACAKNDSAPLLSFVLFVIHFLKSYIFSEGTGLVPEKCVERCTNTLLVGLTRRVSQFADLNLQRRSTIINLQLHFGYGNISKTHITR